jgi:hypothetical protein
MYLYFRIQVLIIYSSLHSIAHCATIRVVAWQPTTPNSSNDMDLLATGSDDRSVRVLSIPVPQ